MQLSLFREKTWGTLSLLLAVFLVALLACSTDAWGRAGDGGSYSGGGSSSSSSSGSSYSSSRGSGGGSGETSDPRTLAFFMVVIGIIMVPQLYRSMVERRTKREIERQLKIQLQHSLKGMMERDPQFTEEGFRIRACQAFREIQESWSQQDMKPSRSFLSDGVFERFQLQIQIMKDSDVRNVFRNVIIHYDEIAAMQSSLQFDTISLSVTASGEDWKEKISTGGRISGSESNQRFTEYWTFNRRLGAKSRESGGTIEGNCPRCGAMLNIVDVAKCQGCDAQVNSGEFDWVLTEITQESEFHQPIAEDDRPGISGLRQEDPGFNVQHIDDRASVMFWRLRASEYYQSFAYAASVMEAEYLQKTAEFMKRHNRYWKDAVVGNVETIEALKRPSGDWQLKVMIRWSGTLTYHEHGWKRSSVERSIRTEVYTLQRKAGVQSAPAEAFSSAGCPNCGAPLSTDDHGNCTFCGVNVTDGSFDWILVDVEWLSSSETANLFTKMAQIRRKTPGIVMSTSPGDAMLTLAILAQAAHVDGVVAERERTVLHKMGKRRGLTGEQVDEVIQQSSSLNAQLPQPQNQEEALSFLDQLVHVFLADGTVSSPERRMLQDFAISANLSNEDLTNAISQKKQELQRALAARISSRTEFKVLRHSR